MPGANREKSSARDCACRLLGRRDHSRRELFLKLKKRGYGEAEIVQALQKLEEEGLLDDTHYARKWLHHFRENKPLGGTRVVAELARRGVDIAVARELVAREYPREEERALLLQAARKEVGKRGIKTLEEALSRVGPFLARRGFGGEDIAAALERVLAEESLE